MIKKEFNFGVFKIFARIEDGFVILKTNMNNATKSIYEEAKKNGKKVRYDDRRHACIQFYDGLNEKEVEQELNRELDAINTNRHKIEAGFKKMVVK